MMMREKGKVCVTGGTGFIGSWLIKKLLDNGYSVTTTVRCDPERKKDYSFLTNLPAASENLEIFTADLNDPDSFIPAIEGCIGVFHVAAQVEFEEKDPLEMVTRPSIDGTLGIMRACLNSKTVKRFVYTSSLSAVVFNNSKLDCVDEESWSDTALNNDSPLVRSYTISKTLTERAVLEFSEQYGYEGLEVVSVAPCLTFGPFICPKFPSSVRLAMALIIGNEKHYGFLWERNMVHIDDVARAHIHLFEHPNAKGRYICSSHRIKLEESVKFISAKYREFPIPSPESLNDLKGIVLKNVSSKKLMDTGFQYKYGIQDMFDGAIQSCKEKGYL